MTSQDVINAQLTMNTAIFQDAAVAKPQDKWVPACGGTETPFRARSGATLLYCWNPARQEHAYLLNGVTVLTFKEAEAHLQLS
jgi:hypothetical protein